MCKFRKGDLVFTIEYHVYILIVKQPDHIPILYIFRYRKPQYFGDKVFNYSSHHLMPWSFFRGDPYKGRCQHVPAPALKQCSILGQAHSKGSQPTDYVRAFYGTLATGLWGPNQVILAINSVTVS